MNRFFYVEIIIVIARPKEPSLFKLMCFSDVTR